MEPAPPHLSQPPPVNQNPLANYQFNSDELRVLRECNSESFFQRSLPIGTSFGLTAFFGVKNGFLKPNIKYGAAPKVVVGVILGYFLGKFSYQRKCIEKMMQLPNSQLGEILRKRYKGGMMEAMTGDSMGMGIALSPFSPSSSNVDVYSDEHMRENTRSSSFNLDTERTPSVGLDDVYRPTLDTPIYSVEPEKPAEPPVKRSTTYEDLRRRHREELLLRKQQSASTRSQLSDAPIIDDNGSDAGGSGHVKKNKYGDTWTG